MASTGSEPLVVPLKDAFELAQSGGKGANLAHLILTGLPVPDGFVVTVAAFEGRGGKLFLELEAEIARAYAALGSPPVAVRSSATAEDLPQASMAGQYETILGVEGLPAVLAAVERCWASRHSDRTQAYLAERGLSGQEIGMAVVVQRLISPDTAGVIFTANPRTGDFGEMLLEAHPGLGEAVVSGAVQPETFVLDYRDGAVKEVLGPRRFYLDSKQLHALWRTAVKIQGVFGRPQDIEWAIRDNQVWVLQSRPITTLRTAQERQDLLDKTVRQLASARAAGRGPWVAHNLGETAGRPTPLSWSVLERFMSGEGGFGRLYRSLGFAPSEEAGREGVLDLIAGRIYLDTARGPGMFFADFPYRYDVELLRSDPDAAQGPPTVPAGSSWDRFGAARRLAGIQRRLEDEAADFDRRFEREIVPPLVDWHCRQKQIDLAGLDVVGWQDLWDERCRRVLDEFAPQSLLPSLIAAMAMERLRNVLAEYCWDEDPRTLAVELSAGGPPDRTLLANQGLWELAIGRQTLDEWLAENGHRASEEFDLASPRWRERPELVEAMAARLADGPSPHARHAESTARSAARWSEVAAKLPRAARDRLQSAVELVHRYLRFREDGKHFLMLGYDLLRDLAVEAGRRLAIGDDVFLLTLEELQQALRSGIAPLGRIERRRAQRANEARLLLPPVIDDPERDLTEPTKHDGRARRPALAVSSGVAVGPARIVRDPLSAPALEPGYVLVCPSTDPSWTPLFVHAAGLIVERGGTLSHGAVVAREMGIPAVVLPAATELFSDGQRLEVDGDRGAVASADSSKDRPTSQSPENDDPADVALPWSQTPPPRGGKEIAAARLRNVFLLAWAAFLAAMFLLPRPRLYDPALRAVDAVLWPLVVALGKPATVAISAAALAVLAMLGQRLLTDNRRLRTAKRRAADLRNKAKTLPVGSPRREAMLRLAAPVPWRLAGAAMVPLAILLGPMVVSFLWYPERVDPASANPSPGATVYVVACIDGKHADEVTLESSPELTLDPLTPETQRPEPIRAVLEDRLVQWQRDSDLSQYPWELQEAGRSAADWLVDDLRRFLDGPMPPQHLAWTLTSPDEPGRYPISVTTGENRLETAAVVGDACPPEPRDDLGEGPVQAVRSTDPESPLLWVRVSYSQPKQAGGEVFWAPVAGAWPRDIGWLGVYLLAYLPAMFLCRWLLRLA